MTTRRSAIASLAATMALTIGLVAAPAAAAGTTHLVDDDGTAGVAGCNGAVAVPTSIQAAVDASGPGDTILVCPGSYPETVAIAGSAHKGLTIRATARYAAKVKPAGVDYAPIIRIASPRVTVQWLKIVAPAGVPCSQASSGILVDGVAQATLRSNLVLAAPAGSTLNPSSGLWEGITIGDGSTGAVVEHNIVRAFQMVGIMVHNADAKVVNNSVQYWHTAPVTATACSRKAPKRTSPATPSAVTGIRSYQSTGTISLNAVTNAPAGQSSSAYVVDGISTQGSDGLRIRRNLVTGGYAGIVINDSDGLLIKGNVLVGTIPPQRPGSATPAQVATFGIGITNGSGSTVRDNRVAHYGIGILMAPGATGNTILDNDATGNGTDCQQFLPTSGAGGGVLPNAWPFNLGNVDSPSDLCTDAPISPIPGSPT